MVKRIVVEINLGALVVQIDLFTAVKLALLLVDSVAGSKVSLEVVEISLRFGFGGGCVCGGLCLVFRFLGTSCHHFVPAPESMVLTYIKQLV